MKYILQLCALPIAVVVATAAAGCSFGTIPSTEHSRVKQVILEHPPLYFDDGKPAQQISRRELVTLALEEDNLMALSMWDDTLRRVWTTRISIPDRKPLYVGTGRKITRYGESPGMAFHNGKHVVLLSTRYSEEDYDSIIAVARLFNPADGRLESMRILTATKMEGYVPVAYRQYYFALSDDSTTILCATPDNAGDEDQSFLRLSTFNADLSPVHARKVPLGKLSRLGAIRVDNLGDVVHVSELDADTISVSRFRMGGGKPDSTLMLHLPHPSNERSYIAGYLADFAGANDLTILSIYIDRLDFVGLRLNKIRTSTMEQPLSTMFEIDQDDFEKMIDDDFRNPSFSKVYVGDRVDSRYLVTMNGETGGLGSDPVYFLLSVDRDGKERWRAAHRRDEAYPLGTHVGTREALQFLTFESNGIVYDEYSLTDGSTVPGARRILSEVPLRALFRYNEFFMWPNNSSVILFVATEKATGLNWYLTRFDILR